MIEPRLTDGTLSQGARIDVGEVLFTYHCNDCHAGEQGLSAVSHIMHGWSDQMIGQVVRQVVQNAELNEFITNPSIAEEPVLHPQWGVFSLFLVLFLGGIALVWWMVYQCVKVNRKEMAEGQ